jgi:transporter family protein
VAAVASIDKLSVLLVAVLAALWLGEQLSPAGWIGVLLMGAGAALVAWP